MISSLLINTPQDKHSLLTPLSTWLPVYQLELRRVSVMCVKLHPDHRHFTTCLTHWGRFRYKVAPQGHMVSGDGFNERYSSITSFFKNVERCVDDSVMWADNIQDSFTQVCEYLDLCARNGVILNPKKFQFCQDMVNFAGLQITDTNVNPSEKLLQSIREFPTPQDITGAGHVHGSDL